MDKHKSLNIIELVQTVQGETSLTGVTTTLIRLAKCNLQCTWCDTMHAFSKGEPMSFSAILDKVKEFSCHHICVTGGEPLLQPNVLLLMRQLCDLNYTVSLETNGSLTIKNVDPRVIAILDVKCPGSNESEKNYWDNLSILRDHDEVKFVIKNEEDYTFAKEVCEKYDLFTRAKPVLFSPVYREQPPKQLVAWMLRDNIPGRLNLQIHKVIWPAETMGV